MKCEVMDSKAQADPSEEAIDPTYVGVNNRRVSPTEELTWQQGIKLSTHWYYIKHKSVLNCICERNGNSQNVPSNYQAENSPLAECMQCICLVSSVSLVSETEKVAHRRFLKATVNGNTTSGHRFFCFWEPHLADSHGSRNTHDRGCHEVCCWYAHVDICG